MNRPLISVVIPLYNKERIIETSLRSVLKQDFPSFEVVVVDDGSTDGSAEVVRHIADPRLRLVSQPNGGPSKARNTGASHAQGEYICFLDADDELLPDALGTLYDRAAAHPEVSMITAECLLDFGDRMVKDRDYREGLLQDGCKAYVLGLLLQQPGSSLYRRDFFLKHRFKENLRRFEDMDMLIRAYLDSTIWMVAKPVVKRNLGFAAASQPRKHIEEDFAGHLSLRQPTFWARMAHYRLFYEEHTHYPEETRHLYPDFYRRRDLHLLMTLLLRLSHTDWGRKLLWRML